MQGQFGCVGDVQPVDVPGSGRVGGHRDVQVVRPDEVALRRGVEGERDEEEVARGGVVQAARIGDERADDAGGPVDLCRIAEERVEVDHSGLVAAVRVVDLEDVVHRLDDVAPADAESLVRRLDAELVAVVGGALVAVVEPVEAGQ